MEKKTIPCKTAVIRAAVFSLLICILICCLTRLVTPKFLLENSDWPSTSTFTRFYDMEKNSVDVIFLGSSSIASAGNPQYLYNSRQITSYNLASPEQTLITSYYWLKEALRFQSPSVVFLDNQMLFTFYEDEVLNFKEPGQRKDFDYMRWSSVKAEAVNDFCSLDPSQSKLSYYLPIVRYHERWKELGKLDFSYETSRLYGYAPLYGSLHEENEPDFIPLATFGSDFESNSELNLESDFELNSESNSNNALNSDIQDTSPLPDDEQILPLMEEYMDKIVSLCEENGIRLILFTTVSPVQTQNRHDLTKQYADANHLTYLDFNTDTLMEAAGIDYFSDCYDTHHMAFSGSEKITAYLGDYLLSEGLATPRDSADFESTRGYYQEFTADF